MESSEEIQKLAETLKNSGLAASMKDALEKAKSMLGKKETEKEEPFEKPIDATQTTLQDTKESREKIAIEESTETEEELKKEDVFTTQKETKKAHNEKKVDHSKEKKIDLTKVFNVNKKS